MGTVVFVHGTGVRRGSYLATYAAIQQAFDRHDIGHTLEACLWGDALGAASVLRSLPDLTLVPQDPRVLTRDQDYARWDLLYRDPLFELRLLKNRPMGGPRPPSLGATVTALWGRISRYRPTDPVLALINTADLGDCWSKAWRAVIEDDSTARQATESSNEVGEPGQAVARAVVAAMLQVAFDREQPLLDGRHRDALVDLLIDDWQARVAGVGAHLLRFFGDMAAQWRRRSSKRAEGGSQRRRIPRRATSSAIRRAGHPSATTFVRPSKDSLVTCICWPTAWAVSPASICSRNSPSRK